MAGRQLKLTLVSLGAMFGVLAAWVAVALLVLRLIATPWPERLPNVRLEPTRPILTAADIHEDNAYYYIRQLTNWSKTLYSDKETRAELDQCMALGWQDGAYPLLGVWISTNAAAIDVATKAASMTNCQVQSAVTFGQDLIPALTDVRSVARMYHVFINRAVEGGDWNQVNVLSRQALTLSSAPSRGGSLIEHLVSMACAEITCSAMRQAVLTRSCPPETTRAMIRGIGEYEAHLEPFAEAFRYDLLSAKHEVRQLFERNPFKGETRVFADISCLPTALFWPFGSNPRTIATHFDDVYSRVIDVATRPYEPSRWRREIGNRFDFGESSPWRWFGNDPLGRLLIGFMCPSVDFAMFRHFEHLAVLRATRVLLAITVYRQDHGGQSPSSLDVLCPDYLDRIPTDPFARDAASLRYRVTATNWVVYSVGRDQNDDDGVLNWRDRRSDSPLDATNSDICVFSDEPQRDHEKYLKQHPATNTTVRAGD